MFFHFTNIKLLIYFFFCSESVKDLTKLFFYVKEEAKNIDPAHVPRLYYVARNFCELYSCVVPTYHKEEIENLPQQTGDYYYFYFF